MMHDREEIQNAIYENVEEIKPQKENKIFSGLAWTFGERIAAQLVSTIVTIILARLLMPEAYGIISIVTVFITFLNVFVTGGFSSALVQKKEADEKDFNTAFVISMLTSVVLYCVLFLMAPYIEKFYKMRQLTAIIRVMGLRLPLAAVNSIQQAYIQRAMAFRRFFLATIVGTIVSGVVGIIMAYMGFGVWALVVQYLTNTTIDTLLLFFVCKWKPKLQFSPRKAKHILGFGWKVLATQMVYTLEADIRSIVVGKVFGPADLAYYDQGKKYPSLLVTNISATIDKVMLPAYSKKQDDLALLKRILRRSIRTGVYLLTPILVGFAVIAENFVQVVLTDKWLFCVPYIQIFCLSYITRPLESSLHQALLAIGKSGLVLWCMIIINAISLALLIIAIWILKSVLAIAMFSLCTSIISYTVFTAFTKKYIGYNLREQMKDLVPSILISVIMGTGVYCATYISMNIIVMLFVQVLLGMLIYLVLSILFRIEPFIYIKKAFKDFIQKKKGE